MGRESKIRAVLFADISESGALYRELASRQHLTVRVMRTRFYLIDHSINGTYVMFERGEEVHVMRGEMPLDRSGEIRLGRPRAGGAGAVITFEHDRRSMYRI